jgi:predicted DNA-binding protein (UPF0251 family)
MSPRPKKERICNCGFIGGAFKPTGIPMTKLEKVTIMSDEIEALKLCDMDGLTQKEAGERMGVSRGTVQRILTSARKKVVTALSGYKALVIEKTTCKEE